MKYYQAMGKTVAVRQVPPGGGQGTLSFLLQDQLGSTVGTVDAVTGSVTRQQYWPYGTLRSGGVMQTDRLYTGQQQEAAASDVLGLYDYKARFYSTTTGRFSSADSNVSDSLNRFAYANSSPLRFTDPSGKDSCNAPAPCPVPLPIPPANSVDPLAACASAPAGCLLWSVGGDWVKFIGAVADQFGISEDVLSAIVLNEMKHRSGTAWQAIRGIERQLRELFNDLPFHVPTGTLDIAGHTFDPHNPSLGVANVKVQTAELLIAAGLVSMPNDLLATLVTPQGSIYFAAAYLGYLKRSFLPLVGDAGNERALMAAYNLGVENYFRAWSDTGCGWCGPEATAYINNTLIELSSSSVDQLAVQLSQ